MIALLTKPSAKDMSGRTPVEELTVGEETDVPRHETSFYGAFISFLCALLIEDTRALVQLRAVCHYARGNTASGIQ
jgi:hypothetical protein